MVEQISSNDVITLILRPNRSASWFQSKLFLMVMMLPMLIISIGWSIAGAWPMVPLVGLEFIVLCYLTYLVSYQSYQKDSITIKQDSLVIHNGIGKKPKEQKEKILKRANTLLYVSRPKRPMDLQTLYLADNNNRIEVGHYLNEDDRERLRTALLGAGLNQRAL